MSGDSERLHELSTAELLAVLQTADGDAVRAAHDAAPDVARLVDVVVERWPQGGRLIYVGAGTSGRIGALDAAECRPTFGIEETRVRAVIAGGASALAQAVEGAEDSETVGRDAIVDLKVGAADVVIALSASGTTPFTCAALEAATSRGATGAAITCSPGSRLAAAAHIPIVIAVGREVIDGSTRMKAGTAQKLVCNAISTAAFIRLGRVWGEQMVAVRTSNDKLRSRATAILQKLTDCADEDAAAALLAAAGDDLPTALVMARSGVARDAAAAFLERAHGDVHRALALAGDGEAS